jgi:DNA-binding CsgD family transcriptional regulator
MTGGRSGGTYASRPSRVSGAGPAGHPPSALLREPPPPRLGGSLPVTTMAAIASCPAEVSGLACRRCGQRMTADLSDVELLRHFAQGIPDRAVAMRLKLTLDGLKSRGRRVRNTFGAANRTQLVDLAIRAGILPPATSPARTPLQRRLRALW